jgi:AcrR family transcriptional regulator
MGRTPSNHYHHGDLRRALLQSAEHLLESEGLDKVSLRAIARIAGVSHAAPYHHFDDVDDLLASVATSGFSRLRHAMSNKAEAVEGPPLTRLQEAGIAYIRFAAENPEVYRLMFSSRLRASENHPELAKAAGEAYATLGALLGRSSPNASAAFGAAQAAWSTVHGLAMLIIDSRLDIDRNDAEAVERAAREVTNVLGRGLRDLVSGA